MPVGSWGTQSIHTHTHTHITINPPMYSDRPHRWSLVFKPLIHHMNNSSTINISTHAHKRSMMRGYKKEKQWKHPVWQLLWIIWVRRWGQGVRMSGSVSSLTNSPCIHDYCCSIGASYLPTDNGSAGRTVCYRSDTNAAQHSLNPPCVWTWGGLKTALRCG